MAKIEMSIEDVLRLLDQRIEEAGGVRAFAREIGVSPSYVSAVTWQKTPPSDRLLGAIGVRRIYVRR